jgi:hypothetical protein
MSRVFNRIVFLDTPRSGAFPFEDGDLLSKGEDFESGIAASTEEHAGCRQD